MTSVDDPLRNRPGLPTLLYRIGDYASFRQRMLNRLMGSFQTNDQPPREISLDSLTTRASDDPAIALMDAVAVVADVLTFYQERLINEGYLGTATERRSVLELARMIGYELHPGVAASTLLAFTVEDAPGSPSQVTVPKGTQVLSIPGQNEMPQTFETSEDLIAHGEWNALRPRSSRPQRITPDSRKLYLQGIGLPLKPGDSLLLMDGEAPAGHYYLITLETVEPLPIAGYTQVSFEAPLVSGTSAESRHPLRHPKVFRFCDLALLFGHNAPDWNAQPKEVKRVNGGTLKGGVFHLTADNSWVGVSSGLPTTDILCLTDMDSLLLAGTSGTGIFRSPNRGKTWEAVNNGLTTLSVQALYCDREQNHLYAGTPSGGVFRSRDGGENWSPIGAGSVRVENQGQNNFQSVNTGLPNTVVRSLLTHTTRLVTPGEGKVQTKENNTIKLIQDPDILDHPIRLGDTITVANQSRIVTAINFNNSDNPTSSDLTLNTPLNPTVAIPSSFLVGGTYLFAGTDEGIYRSIDQGKNWELKGSPDPVIYALAKANTSQSLTGTISTVGKTVLGTQTRFDSQLAIGNQIQVSGQTRTVTAIINSPTLLLTTALNKDIPNNTSGILIRFGSGQITSVEEFVFRSQIIRRVKGSGTRFLSELRPQDTITLSQRDFSLLQVNHIESDTSFITIQNISGTSRESIRREIPLQSSFSFNRSMPGTFSGKGNELYATDADALKQVRAGDQIRLGDQTGTVVRVADQLLRVDQSFNADVTQVPVTLVAFSLFAATDRGILQSSEKQPSQGWIALGEKWEFINQGLGTDLDLRSLLTTATGDLYTGSATGRIYQFRRQDNRWHFVGSTLSSQPVTALVQVGEPLWAGTAGGGVFRRVGDRWEAVNFQLFSPMVTGLVGGSDLFAATRFLGFMEDTLQDTRENTTPENDDNSSKGEWPGFILTATETTIDLDTTYPRIVADSWVVLRDKNQFIVRQVKATDILNQARFSLTGKTTHLEITAPLTRSFGRRTTQVLAASEPLLLANESLTVAIQQQNLFFDPIHANTVFLNEFVSGLQPQQRAMIQGKRLRVVLNDIAGIFTSTDQENSWVRSNVGLTNTGVTALAIAPPTQNQPQNQTLYAGTVSSGVFVSVDLGKTWQPLPGLPEGIVQAIAVTQAGIPLVGTEQGLFGYWEGCWHNLKLSQVHTDVRAIAVQVQTGQDGNAQEQVLVGTINGGVFRSRLPISLQTLEATAQATTNSQSLWVQTTLNNTDVQALVVSADAAAIAAGTADGFVFFSKDGGSSWIALGEDRRILVNVTALAFGLAQLSDNSSDTPSNNLIIWAGTAGSGIFRWSFRSAIPEWEAISTQLTDLNIRTLAVFESGLFAGTATGGVFRSIDQGNQWAPINLGLTSTDTTINPNHWVNTDIRAIAQIHIPQIESESQALKSQLFVAGVGTLIAPDGLVVVPVKTGDQLQLLAPPTPLQEESLSSALQQGVPQKWQLKDKEGFTGLVFAIAASDFTLQPALDQDEVESEAVMIQSPPTDQQQPVIKLVEPIQGCYDPATVSLNANVVPATHGETVQEVLGSGDGTAMNQSFTLKKTPLTYVSAATPSGSESSLEVRVNQVRWQEVSSLYQRSPLETSYILRRSEDSVTTVIFGNGRSGARLPSGMENITAVYRSGLGLAGQVPAHTLSLLKTRPLGIREVTNPLAATGAADPETMAEARTSAPLTLRTLDRIVSLQDYEDFARSFAGIGKAQAIVLRTGNDQQVHVTVAAQGGGSVMPGTALYDHLVQAINTIRDPLHRVQVDSYEPLLFNLEATVLIDPRYLPDTVLTQVTSALQQTFTFEKRAFGQPVTASEAIAAIQAIAGVIAVDLDALYRRNLPKRLEQRLIALSARLESNSDPLQPSQTIQPAQLLLLNPTGIYLKSG
jgi:hypothetical protein